MSFDWDNYRVLAEALASEPRAELLEASLRSAISRAYYAAFKVAEQTASDRGLPPLERGQNSHERVWRHFNSANKKLSLIKERGFELRDLRVQADYVDTTDRLAEKVENALALSRRIILNCRAHGHLLSPPR